MKCLCGFDNPHAATRCAACHAALELRCAWCGHGNATDSRYCNRCGHAFEEADAAGFAPPETYTPRHLAEKILVSKSALEGERKLITVLFCDIAESTALAGRLGPEAMHTLLSRFFDLALAEVHRFEGTVNQFLGDGFMALFGAPVAYEDHARWAILAAWAIQERLKAQRATVVPLPDAEVAVRMGLNTGVVVVGKIGDNLRMDYTAVGDTTHLAARLQQLAEPGTILVSERTLRAARDWVDAEQLDALHVKGVNEAVTAHRVVNVVSRRGVREEGGRGLGPFVGRQRELAQLEELTRDVQSGQGRVVGIVGEPGVGKSRLLAEFHRRGAGLRYLEGRCLSFGRTMPYLPVLDLLRAQCGIADGDAPDVIADKIRATMRDAGMEEQAVAYLLRLFGIATAPDPLAVVTPEAIQARTFEILRHLAVSASRRQPLILAVEDLHWSDRTSEQYFTSLVESIAGEPLMLVATYRRGYRPPWVAKPHAREIELQPLSSQDSLMVLQSLTAGRPLSDHEAQQILDRAEGNPFFLEELARAVSEHSDIAIPETVEAVLTARIDRLSPESKRLLQTAAVLGRAVPAALLEAVWDGPGGFQSPLAELVRLEFLYERRASAQGTWYVFKHALTQQAAYEALLRSQRQLLHAAAGRALEALYAGRLEEAYDRLAYHYARTEETAKAIEYLARVARRAARGYSHEEATAVLQEALAHAERLPPAVADPVILGLVLRQVQPLNFLGRNQESLDLLLAQRERVARLQDVAQSCRYNFSLGLTYNFVGDRDRAADHVARALDEAERCGDERTMGRASALLTLEEYWSGRPHQGIERGQRAVALLEKTREAYWLAQTHFYLAGNYYLMGALRPALEAAMRAESIGEAIGDAGVRSYAAATLGGIYASAGEFEAAVPACRRGLDLAPDPLARAQAQGFWGYACLEQGDTAQALPLLEEAARQMERFRYRQLHGWFTVMLGEGYGLRGQSRRARELLLRGLAVTQEVKYGLGIGWAQRGLGRLALASGSVEEASRQLIDAIACFRSVGARFEVGRTQMALAELATRAGDAREATSQLRAAHRVFAELDVPTYVARAEQQAAKAGLSLSEA